MLEKFKNKHLLLAEDNVHVRRILLDLLRADGFSNVVTALSKKDLLEKVQEFHPKIVLIAVEFPEISAQDFARLVRGGSGAINRATSIIATTRTMTSALLDDLRKSGVDEVLTQPYSAGAVMARVESVLLRPRRFIESANYRGPCRRRKMLEDYGGPLRRLTDPESDAGETWEAESNRALVRLCVSKISDLAQDLTDIDRRKLRALYAAAQDTEQLADDIKDERLSEAARSLNRYIVGVGAANNADPEVIRTHIDAMLTLTLLGSQHEKERQDLIRGLTAVVDKRLGIRPSLDAVG